MKLALGEAIREGAKNSSGNPLYTLYTMFQCNIGVFLTPFLAFLLLALYTINTMLPPEGYYIRGAYKKFFNLIKNTYNH